MCNFGVDVVETVMENIDEYEKGFLKPTLFPTNETRIVIESRFRIRGAIKEAVLVVDYDSPPHRSLWAVNGVRQKNNTTFGVIHVNPELRRQEIDLQKFVLAKEWLEVALAVLEPQTRRLKMVLGRVQIVDLFNRMGKRVLWQDSQDELMRLHRGLRHLLVPDTMIKAVIENEFRTSPEALREKMECQMSAAIRIIEQIARLIAATKHVNRFLVDDRLQEFLLEFQC